MKIFIITIIIIFLSLAGFYLIKNKKDFGDGREKKQPWITVAPNKRYLMFEDGRSFFPIGTASAGEQLQADYWGRVQYKEDKFPFYEIDVEIDPNGLEKYMAEMKKNGENTLRVATDGWTFSQNEGFIKYLINSKRARFLENPAGVFDEEYAKRIDKLFYLAEKYGIYIDFLISPDTVQWRQFIHLHPYSKSNGGFMENEGDIFTSSEGKKIYKNRIKYIIDRWGSSPNILAWELFNEMNWWGGENSLKKEKAEWVDEMGAFLREYEKNKYGKNHLIITSTSHYTGPEDYFFNSPQMDMAVTHYYFGEVNFPDPYLNAKKIKESTENNIENRMDYEKPFLENERSVGRCWVSVDIELAISLAEIANGAAGSGLSWVHMEKYLPESKTKFDFNNAYRIDYLQKMDTTMRRGFVADNNKAISKIVSHINWANFDSKIINKNVSISDKSAEVMAVGDGSTIFGFLIRDHKQDYLIDFLKNTADYPDGCGGNIAPVFDGVIKLASFYKSKNINLDIKPLEDIAVKNTQKQFGVTSEKAKQLINEAYSNPQTLKQNMKNNLPREFIYKIGVDIAELMKETENQYHLLSDNYKGYPKTNMNLNINGLASGDHKIEWIDPKNGENIFIQKFSGNSASLKTPEFSKFLIFIISDAN